MLEKIKSFLEENLAPWANKFGNHKYVKAITHSMIATISLSIIGGISLLIASPPIDPEVVQPTNIFYKFMLSWHAFAVKHGPTIIEPFELTMGIISIFVAMGVA